MSTQRIGAAAATNPNLWRLARKIEELRKSDDPEDRALLQSYCRAHGTMAMREQYRQQGKLS